MIDYDLHIHTTASDGLFSPEGVLKTAANKGLRGIAVTDHDTIGALAECEHMAYRYNVDFITGIEISTDYMNYEIHILGYFIDYTDRLLLRFLDWMQQTREDRNRKMVELLQRQGYDICYEEIANMKKDNKSIGRPHIARSLIEKGYFQNMSEVFNKLLGAGKTAYVSREKISIRKAADVISGAKGIPVVAHPLIDNRFNDIESFIKICIESGIKGIEVFHSLHSKEQEHYLYNLADKYKLGITGGSDCHGELIDGNYLLGSKGISANEMLELKKIKR